MYQVYGRGGYQGTYATREAAVEAAREGARDDRRVYEVFHVASRAIVARIEPVAGSGYSFGRR